MSEQLIQKTSLLTLSLAKSWLFFDGSDMDMTNLSDEQRTHSSSISFNSSCSLFIVLDELREAIIGYKLPHFLLLFHPDEIVVRQQQELMSLNCSGCIPAALTWSVFFQTKSGSTTFCCDSKGT